MQYYKPSGDLNVGDCMPFFHDGLFRLFYLIDEGHHHALGGLGGHQWAQATSRDLVTWTHHPLAIAITDEREGSICTGSVLYHAGTYYGFYATRMRDWTQHLSLATSRDGVHFDKVEPNPFASPPPGYSPYDYRDPCAFYSPADGRFHLLVTASLAAYAVPGRGGCLAHLVSADLACWEVREPFIIPGLPGAPECPDYFGWRGWYYLIFSNEGIARYRMSRGPFGPWLRPPVDTLDGPAARVMKTTAFTGDRRIGVAWIGTREGDRDDGGFQFGGNALFRELVQRPDGTLGASFVPDMAPAGEPLPALRIEPLGLGASAEGDRIHLCAGAPLAAGSGAHREPPALRAWPPVPTGAAPGDATEPGPVAAAVGEPECDSARGPHAGAGLAAARLTGVPRRARIALHVTPAPGTAGFGLRLRAGEAFDEGYALDFAPHDATVRLNQQRLTGVAGLDRPFDLEIVLYDDLIDVRVDAGGGHSRTLTDRCPQRVGESAYVYVADGEVAVSGVVVERLGSEVTRGAALRTPAPGQPVT